MKYSLRFGRVARPAEYESVKVEYEQEYDDSDIPREAAFDDLRTFVYKKLEEELAMSAEKYVRAAEQAAEKPKTPMKKEVPQVEEKSLEHYYPQVETLPWQAFKEKRPAEPGEAAWIFTNTPGLEDLAYAVKKEGAMFVRMGGHRFLCKLSGNEDQFTQRIPQDKKGEKRQ